VKKRRTCSANADPIGDITPQGTDGMAFGLTKYLLLVYHSLAKEDII